jgi:hypothetical protein
LNNSPTFLPFFVGTPFNENLNLHVVSGVRVALCDAFSIVEVAEDNLLVLAIFIILLVGENALDVPSARKRSASIVGSE